MKQTKISDYVDDSTISRFVLNTPQCHMIFSEHLCLGSQLCRVEMRKRLTQDLAPDTKGQFLRDAHDWRHCWYAILVAHWRLFLINQLVAVVARDSVPVEFRRDAIFRDKYYPIYFGTPTTLGTLLRFEAILKIGTVYRDFGNDYDDFHEIWYVEVSRFVGRQR